MNFIAADTEIDVEEAALAATESRPNLSVKLRSRAKMDSETVLQSSMDEDFSHLLKDANVYRSTLKSFQVSEFNGLLC